MDIKKKKTVAPQTAAPVKSNIPEPKKADFAFSRENYVIMMVGLAVILLGFILMIGGGSDNPKVFNDAIFNFQHLTLSPILILIGYGIEIYAIMKTPKTQE